MKKLKFFVLFVCCSLVVHAQFSGSGSGTQEDPYLIMNVTQLSQMANFLGQDGVVFKLQKNLNLSSWIAEENPRQGWAPVGVGSEPFKGILIGNNKTISGLTITRSSESNVGFFGCLDGATISDLTIEGTNLTGSSYLGTFAGKVSNSSISNIHVKLTGTVTAASGEYVGGFMGYGSNSTITNCNVEATVTSTGATYVGGFGGGINMVTITNSIVIGNVTGISCVAGYVAKTDGTEAFTSCSYFGDLVGEINVGGISAYLSEGSFATFTSCCTRGKITATGDYVGGIVGVSQGACIAGMENCSHYGDIKAGSNVGGLVGAIIAKNDTAPTTFAHYHLIQTTYGGNKPKDTDLGTFDETLTAGNTYIKQINNSISYGSIIGQNYVGGIVGYMESSVNYITNQKSVTFPCSVSQIISIYESGNFKGSVPQLKDQYSYTLKYNLYTENLSEYAIINNSFQGLIVGKEYVGGVTGFFYGGSVLNCSTCAEMYCENIVGGIAGAVHGKSVSTLQMKANVFSNISNNYIISGDSNIGRIYGSADLDYVTIGGLGSITGNRAWLKTQVIVNGVIQEVEDNLQNGTSVGTNTLKTKANYQAWGWNFDKDWNILDGVSYPYKKYQAAPASIESALVSQATTISGRSVSGGTVYLSYKGQEPIAIDCVGDTWSVDVEPLQSGASIEIYAETDNLVPSYPMTFTVSPLGTGTEDDPYQIYTAYDLQGISKQGYYKLMNDIDVTDWITENSPEEGWLPVGQTGMETVYIDGDKHKVKGLWSNTSSSYNGLFGNLSGGGYVKNLSVEVTAGKKLQGGDFGGVLAGYAIDMTFENCIVNGSIETSSYAGGLVGYAKGGSISQCFSKGNVKATGEHGYAGGMVAYSSASIVNSYSMSNVEASEYVAGLVAYSFAAIDKCYAQGNVTGMKYAAGIVAQLDGSSATVTQCVALNEAITMPAQYAWACRVLSGYKNGSPDPDESNLALSTMQVILNDREETKYDDEMEGIGKTQEELMQAAMYQSIGWDFPSVWSIKEGKTYPFLVSEIQRGDVNKDGTVDVSDAIAISNHIIKRPSVMFIEEAADVNNDGVIDVSDAIGVMNIILGRPIGN